MKLFLRICLICMALGAAVGLSVLTAVCVCAGRTWTPVQSDCIVVLGAHVWMDGRLSNALTYRCEAALKAWKDGVAPALILCGARGKDEPVTEAEAMYGWMLDHGVPESAVIMEDRSLNTRQNIANAQAIMVERGWKTAAVCTNDYHLTRALWIARDAGLHATGIAAPSTKDIPSLVRGRLRETCSWILYFIRKFIPNQGV